jgi:DNA-directed RNA polymerase subunit E'/Rpb7
MLSEYESVVTLLPCELDCNFQKTIFDKLQMYGEGMVVNGFDNARGTKFMDYIGKVTKILKITKTTVSTRTGCCPFKVRFYAIVWRAYYKALYKGIIKNTLLNQKIIQSGPFLFVGYTEENHKVGDEIVFECNF